MAFVGDDTDRVTAAIEQAKTDLGGGRVPLSSVLMLADMEPERFTNRLKRRGNGLEPKRYWSHRAMCEVLWAVGIDPNQILGES